VQTAENPAQAIDHTAESIESWRQKANLELDKLVQLFSSTQLPDMCAMALINAPERPSSKWSMGNQLLMVIAGTADARGYKQWLDVGRHVKAGAKAFRILGPVIIKKPLETNKEEESVEVLVGFRAIPVFRYEDTEGEELPTYTPRNPPPLLDVASRFGMRVNYLRLSAGVYGMTDYERQVITLATEDWTVFFHELAHALHRSFEPKSGHGQEPEAEAIAQLVAGTLARLYERPADGFSWTYIASQAGSGNPQQVGRLCMHVLDRAKNVLDLIYETTAA